MGQINYIKTFHSLAIECTLFSLACSTLQDRPYDSAQNKIQQIYKRLEHHFLHPKYNKTRTQKEESCWK